MCTQSDLGTQLRYDTAAKLRVKSYKCCDERRSLTLVFVRGPNLVFGDRRITDNISSLKLNVSPERWCHSRPYEKAEFQMLFYNSVGFLHKCLE